MKALKKILASVCGAMALGCLAIGGFALKTDVAEAGSSGDNYLVGGASVRLVNDQHGPGVKFHVWMTLDEFDRYGTINGDTLTLDSGYTTGTIVLPNYLLNGDELVFGYVASNGAKAHCEYTNKLWHKVEIDHLWYAESIVYLHNIPANQYGTEMAVRGVVFKNGEPIRYTQQEGHISMSYVANEEYKDPNTKLDGEQLESLRDTYLKKDITVMVNGKETMTNADYLDDISVIAPARQEDGDELVGFYTEAGKEVDLSAGIKNPMKVYARYRESIVLNAATPSYNLGAYKKNATDTVKSMIFTAKSGTAYDLGANPEDVTAGAGYATLKTAYTDHGEGTVTAVLNDGAADYTLELPALVVTADIASAKEFDIVFACDASISPYYGASQKNAFIGYYRLAKDIGYIGTSMDDSWTFNGLGRSGADVWINSTSNGLCATFDGNGHTITGVSGNGGLFNCIGAGAVIKNVNIISHGHGGNSHVAVLAKTICGTKAKNVLFENVNITFKPTLKSPYSNFPTSQQHIGFLSSTGTSGTTFRNVTVDASSIQDRTDRYTFIFVFGNGNDAYYESHFADRTQANPNTYEGFYLYGRFQPNDTDRTDCLGLTYDFATSTSKLVTVADEIAAGEEIIYNGVGSNKNAITLDEEVFVFNGTTASRKFALDLGKHDDGFTVQSIKFNGFDLGKNVNALDVSALKEDFSAHGEGEIVVLLRNVETTKTVVVPVVFVTQEIMTSDELLNVLLYKKESNAYFDGSAIFGYFRLGKDMWVSAWSNHNSNDYSAYTRSNKAHGFRGTFDGNGYTLSAYSVGAYGLFTSIGQGALIKDLNIKHTYYNNDNYTAFLGDYILGATIENVTITAGQQSGKYTAGVEMATYANKGLLTGNGASASTFRNVTVDVSGGIYTIFGGYNWSGQYEKTAFGGQNAYENFVINATAVDYIGFTSVNSVATGVTIAEEVASGAGVLFNEQWEENTVTLDHTEEFMMLHTEFFMDIGEYATQKIESITLDGVDLGKDLDNLDLSVFREDYQNHGEKTIKVVCVSGKTRTTVNVPAVLISQNLYTESDLISVLTFNTSNRFFNASKKAVFGYFRLRNDIKVSNWTNYNNADGITHTNKSQGFRATFDGATHTISGSSVGSFGLFTSIGEGAVIKNVNLYVNGYYNGGYGTILANYIQGATIENVGVTAKESKYYDASKPTETITEKDENGKEVTIQTSRYHQAGFLCVNGASGTTFRNVTVNTNGDIYTLFGGFTWHEYEKESIGQNVYDNFAINASHIDFIGFNAKHYKATGVSVEEEIFAGEGIVYNGKNVAQMATDMTFVHHDIVLAGKNADNGSKQKIDFGMYLVYGQNIKAVSVAMPDGTTHNFTYNEGLDLLNGNVTDIIPAAILSNVALHGEGYTLVITTQYGNKITVPVSIVTYEITSGSELNSSSTSIFMFNSNNPYFDADTNTIDGYFTLGNDVGFWTSPNNFNGNDTGFDMEKSKVEWGFVGTFDGRGFTLKNEAQDGVGSSGQAVSGEASTFGLFGQLGAGALVKNTIFEINTYTHKQHTSALAETAYNATIQNVTFRVTNITSYDGEMIQVVGLITARAISGCTFTDVTVDLNGGHVESLFGGRSTNGYEEDRTFIRNKDTEDEYEVTYGGQNTYENFVINGAVDYMGTTYGTDAEGKIIDKHVTVADEIASGENITYNP